MIINSVASFFNDIISFNKENKYKILEIKNNQEGKINVLCCVLSEMREIVLSLDDIIQNNKLKYFSTKDIVELSNLFYTKNSNNFKIAPYHSKYLTILTQLFIIAFLASNIAAAKLVYFMGITFSGGMVTFPLLYVINDIVTEVYGFRESRRIIWLALFLNFLLFSILYGIVYLPSYSNDINHTAFNVVFSLSPRIFLASMCSYLIAEFLNSFTLTRLKIKFKGSYFGIRALISTFCAALIDTAIFFCIVFIDVVNTNELITNIILLAFVKVIYELLLLPITINIVSFLKKHENLNIFEKPNLNSLNPFN